MEEKIYIELIKEGIKIASKSFLKAIDSINKSRLKKKKKKLEVKQKNIDSNQINLNPNEELKGNIQLDIERTNNSVQTHIQEIQRWAQVIKFSDLDKKRSLGSIYIQLDTYLLPVKRHFNQKEKNNTLPLEKAVLSGKDHCVILGQPGAGKTTSLKKICDLIIKEETKTKYTIPILLRFRHLDEKISSSPILDYILDILPIEFDFSKNENTNSNEILKAKESALFSFLNTINAIIILDGFDELKDDTTKNIVLKELRKFTPRLTESKIVLSCRTGEFNYELEHSNTYEIAPLSNKQIELFVHRWLNDKNKAEDFLYKVKNSPFADTSIKPLSLAHLCAIYQRIGNVPEQPKTIYRKVVNLLIEEWDEQRSIIRKSSFVGFQTDQKFEFLTHLSFYLTTEFQSSTFSRTQFKKAFKNLFEYHNLPSNSATNVVKELESHTGLFVESGYDKFEFVHKSIQEYLTAEYLVKLPSLNSIKNKIEILGSELAIAVSISSNSSLYFIELVLNYTNRLKLSDTFYNSFISRIISENPSFKQEEFVSVAFLVLISNWINLDNKKINQYRAQSIDLKDYTILNSLSQSLNLKEQKVKVFKYYKANRSLHKNMFVELIRIKVPENHKRLPTKIYLPIEFYDNLIE